MLHFSSKGASKGSWKNDIIKYVYFGVENMEIYKFFIKSALMNFVKAFSCLLF